MEQILEYMTRLTQGNLLLGLTLVAGVFIILICIMVLDRKISYVRRQLDAVIKHYGLEVAPEPPREKIQFTKKKKETSQTPENTAE